MRNFIACVGFALAFAPLAAHAETPVERGQYLVKIGGCSDCHTPGGMLGTPDKETGLGKWTLEQIIASFTTGVTPDGRKLSEIMPWPSFAHLTPEDAKAVALYLQSLPPVKNAIPGPYKAGETPAVPYVSVVIPTAQYLALPK